MELERPLHKLYLTKILAESFDPKGKGRGRGDTASGDVAEEALVEEAVRAFRNQLLK